MYLRKFDILSDTIISLGLQLIQAEGEIDTY